MQSRQAKNRLLLIFGFLVIAASIATAFFFGERSPLIASGRVKLTESLESQAQGMRTLYVIVRDATSPLPMPWGALSVTLQKEPKGDFYSFVLTRDNLRIMNPSSSPPQRIHIKARLDLDGMGGGDLPGDIVGSVSDVPFGSKDITIELNELISEASTNPSAISP